MNKKTGLILILVVSVLCVLTVICGTAAYTGYRAFIAATPSLSTSVSTTGGQSSGKASSAQAAAGGTLRLYGSLPPTLDPAMAQDSTSAEYITHLFSGLVTLDSKLEIVPDLASEWKVSEDGKTFTFTLLPEARFADGRAITSADVIYSLERACSPELGSPVATSYLGDIVGVEAFSQGQAEHIAGLKAPSERIVEITIDAPKAYFLAKLTYPTAYVVDRQQIEKDSSNWFRQPNGSGPFKLESLARDKIVLVRNERYYRPLPALARVEYTLSGGMPITMYENDLLDIVDVAPSEIERVLDPDNPLHAEYRMTSELSVQYVGLNVAMPPFDDMAVRQAFAQAIDRNKLADLVLQGTATPAKGILPPAMPDYDANLEGWLYDPAKARQLLAGSRYGQPGAMPPITLAIVGESGHMPADTRAVLGMLQENLGITMTVEQVAWGDFLNDMNAHRYQAYMVGWIADYPDSQNFVDLLFHSQSSQNHTGYSNPAVDKLLEQARVERDAAQRTNFYRQAERIIIQEASWLPLTHGLSYTLVKPRVQGFQGNTAVYPWLKDISLTEH